VKVYFGYVLEVVKVLSDRCVACVSSLVCFSIVLVCSFLPVLSQRIVFLFLLFNKSLNVGRFGHKLFMLVDSKNAMNSLNILNLECLHIVFDNKSSYKAVCE